jgi:hypothetical protein
MAKPPTPATATQPTSLSTPPPPPPPTAAAHSPTPPLATNAPSIQTTVVQEQQQPVIAQGSSIKLGTDSEEEGEVKSIISISPPPQDTSNLKSLPITESIVTEPIATEEPILHELPIKTDEEKVKEFTSAIEEALEDGEIEEGEIAD